jgi:CBS domain containing-hemolysin-like protein
MGFVAAEFAIAGAAGEHRASGGAGSVCQKRAASSKIPLQDRYIATTQIGISVASLGLESTANIGSPIASRRTCTTDTTG